MTPKYSIGDMVWWANSGSELRWIKCPDCGGTRHILLIMHDGTEHSIKCGRCSAGYEPPKGIISYYEFNANPEIGNVAGIEINHKGEIEYKLSYYKNGHGRIYVVPETDLFIKEHEALAKAEQLIKDYNKEELDKINRKEKDTRTWAWNVSYHRKCIKDAEKSLAHHTAKLNAAKLHVKVVT